MDGNQQSPRTVEIQKVIEQRSAPTGAAGDELVKYVLVELDITRNHHQEFQRRMPDLVELMFDHKRWELVFASYPIAGIVNRFVHIWKIPDESTLVEVMREGAVELRPLPPKGSIEEEFRECYLGVQELIQSTNHTLMTSLPYDPTHVGFQSQTILIDAGDEPFIIDHAKLRVLASRNDVSEDLETVRRSLFRRQRRSGEKVFAHPDAERALEALRRADEDRVPELVELQKHLNRGSTVARVTFDKRQALLFNLASLKSKSVFQEVQPIEAATNPDLGMVSSGGDGKADLPVASILVAMPWGGVYHLDADVMKVVTQPIPASQKRATDTALAPIRSGQVPVAAIPEEREDIIGDGCACFVINLKSFVTRSATPGSSKRRSGRPPRQ